MNNTNVNAPLLGRGWGRLFLLLAFLGLSSANAQVGIGTNDPENTAALDVESTTKGFLPPRMDTNQRDAINGGTIAQGLVIYNTDVNCLQWYDGTDWFDPCEGGISSGGSGGGGQQTNPIPLCASFSTTVVDVSGANGTLWMDRNLGADQTATGDLLDDFEAIGDKYQWGRSGDGHQCFDAEIYTTIIDGVGVPNFDVAGNEWEGQFIARDSDDNNWLNPSVQDADNLWDGLNGINNPCPTDFRVPTQAEWQAEIDSWTATDASGALDSDLNLIGSGFTDRQGNREVNFSFDNGYYWTSTISGAEAVSLQFTDSGASFTTSARAQGYSVRCVRDGQQAPDPLPTGITLQPIEDYFIASADDDDYLDASGNLPINTTEAQLPGGTEDVADASTNDELIDIQGTLTTTGVTLNIPYETTGAVTLPAYSQTLSIFSDFTENDVETDVTFSYPETTITTAETGFIQATLKAETSDLLAKKLDLNSGFGPDYLGLVIGMFSYALDDQATQADFNLRIIPGIPDKNFGDGVHDFLYLPVTGPSGETWLNNNLGANYANIDNAAFNPAQQATAPADANAYGNYFQWGRDGDGHEFINSPTTPGPVAAGTEGSNFITNSGDDWLLTQDNTRWGDPNDTDKGVHDPCPDGFRVPSQAEWQAEINAGNWTNSASAANSDLALSVAGNRTRNDQKLAIGSIGIYWSSTVFGAQARRLFIQNTGISFNTFSRPSGHSVRCLKD